MKPFDLQAALNGELVQLSDGNCARIVYMHDADSRNIHGIWVEHKLIGFVLTKDGKILKESETWTLEGKVGMVTEDDPWGIVGMYQKPTRLDVLAEAWDRGLRVRSTETGAVYDVCAMTKDGDFVLESVDRGWMSRLKHTEFELVEE